MDRDVEEEPHSSSRDRYIQTEQEKHFHPANAAVGRRDSGVLPASRIVLFQFPQHISRTQGKSKRTVKHKVMNSHGTTSQNCFQPLGNAGESTPLHSTSE